MGQTKKKREVDITWKHCESVPPHRLLVKCKYCSHQCWGGVARMKNHFAGTRIDVIPCPSVPDDVKAIFEKLLEDKEANKNEASQALEEVGTKENTKKGTKSARQQTMNEMLKD